jgi:hypothetical protein
MNCVACAAAAAAAVAAACSQNIVVPLQSNTPEEMDSNVQRILQWIAAYKSQHGLS